MPTTIDHTRTVTQDAYLEIAKGNVPGSSIVQVVGQNTNVGKAHQDISDIGILSTLDYDAQTLNFTIGETITGATSGATAIIVDDIDNGVDGTLYIRNITLDFTDNEVITSAGGSATVNEPITPFTQKQIRKVYEPTTAVTFEVFCESPDDAIGGIGARVLLATFMEKLTGLYVNEVIALNGQTPVSFTSPDGYRFRGGTIIAWGSATNDFVGKTNLGNILIRDSVTKNIAGLILYDISVVGDEHGLNSTFNSNYTFEAGVTGYPVFLLGNSAKGNDVNISTMGQLDGSEGYFFFGELATYQNSWLLSGIPPAPIPEKTTVKFVAKSDNPSVVVNSQSVFIVIENG